MDQWWWPGFNQRSTHVVDATQRWGEYQGDGPWYVFAVVGSGFFAFTAAWHKHWHPMGGSKLWSLKFPGMAHGACDIRFLYETWHQSVLARSLFYYDCRARALLYCCVQIVGSHKNVCHWFIYENGSSKKWWHHTNLLRMADVFFQTWLVYS